MSQPGVRTRQGDGLVRVHKRGLRAPAPQCGDLSNAMRLVDRW